MDKQSIQLGRFCRECEHYYACSAQCGGLLHNTDATHCANFANISAYQREIERLRLVVDEQDLALQKAENDLNTSRQAKWISVEERLPEDYEDVVIIMRDGASSWYRVAYREYGGWSFGGGRRVNDEVTHWMHLPEPPKEE